MIPAPPKIDEADIPIRMSSARRDLAFIAATLMAGNDIYTSGPMNYELAVYDAYNLILMAKNFDYDTSAYIGSDL